MHRTVRLSAAAAVFASLALAPSASAAENLKVVATFSIIGDFARNVGGHRIELTTLVGPNGDAHVYEPKPADAVAVSDADVVLMNGLQFEGFLQRLIESSGSRASIVEITRGGKILYGASAADAHGAADPHAWQSVRNARVYVQNIADAFCATDADGCDTYRVNARSYAEKLQALEDEIRAAVAEIPEARRTLITSHDAFGYFEHEYGIRFLAPQGIATDSEASAADVAALIRQLKAERASAVFVENITDPRLVEQIASETGLKIGGELFSDALSTPDGPAATYIDMMRHNIGEIRRAIAH